MSAARNKEGGPSRGSRCGGYSHHPGLHRFFQGATWLWAGIFLLLTIALAVLMVTEPVNVFLLLTTAVTAVLVVAGTGASALWFRSASCVGSGSGSASRSLSPAASDPG